MNFKNFRSPGEDIFISSTSGHGAVITKDFISIPDVLWREAYSAGALSEEMKTEGMKDYIEEKKAEKLQEELAQRALDKEALRVVYNSPVGSVDKEGRLIHRKAIAAIKRSVKKDYIDSIWNELIEEAGE
jgi:hypothetical protein